MVKNTLMHFPKIVIFKLQKYFSKNHTSNCNEINCVGISTHVSMDCHGKIFKNISLNI